MYNLKEAESLDGVLSEILEHVRNLAISLNLNARAQGPLIEALFPSTCSFILLHSKINIHRLKPRDPIMVPQFLYLMLICWGFFKVQISWQRTVESQSASASSTLYKAKMMNVLLLDIPFTMQCLVKSTEILFITGVLSHRTCFHGMNSGLNNMFRFSLYFSAVPKTLSASTTSCQCAEPGGDFLSSVFAATPTGSTHVSALPPVLCGQEISMWLAISIYGVGF